jgi:acyl carrier protein
MLMPGSTEIEAAVVEVLKDVSRRPIEPTPASDLVVDLGFDSLQILEVVAALEDRFGIAVPPDEIAGTRTVAQVVARTARLVSDRGGQGAR